MRNKVLLFAKSLLLFALAGCASKIQQKKQDPTEDSTQTKQAALLNPILPGYFADPTIKKFGDIYYIYSTTDNIMLASGAPTVWYSKDLENWYNYTMEVPNFTKIPLVNFWAPDIVEKDGKYYLYFGNCEMGCNIYGYESTTPVGPWKKLSENDTPVIPHNYPRQGFPSLDAQFFTDSDGKTYGYWGTWVHYNGGYAAGELNTSTMKDMKGPANIPLTETPGPFEAAYMMKKGDKYILMYSGASCHDETYNVRYSYASTPYGPFTPGANNPILSTNKDKTVHGPGHHSVLQEGDDYYMVYHKHDYPMTRGGLSRQVCMDKMIFENDSTIKAVVPENTGYPMSSEKKVPKNIALNKTASASSYYHLQSLTDDYKYQPSFATDNNNATLWKAGSNALPQNLSIDLGKEKQIKRIFTQFEFPSFYYQYLIHYSTDGKNWKLFSDRSNNRMPGSPMIDDNNVKARYIRLTVTGTEKIGLYAAVWNMKVYETLFETPLPVKNKNADTEPAVTSKREMLLDLNAKAIATDKPLTTVENKGKTGGVFTKTGDVMVEKDENGVTVLKFVKGSLVLDQPVPKQLAWNGSFTIATWVKNPEIGKEGECLLSFCNRRGVRLANSYNALLYNSGPFGAAAHLDGHFDMRYKQLPKANEWHYIVLTFDGIVEKVYVDGVLNNAQNMTLSSYIDKAKIIVGASDNGENYTGLMSSLRMYDYALNKEEIMKGMEETKPSK